MRAPPGRTTPARGRMRLLAGQGEVSPDLLRSLPVSSWISTATLASASACLRLWWAQNSSSPSPGSSTRTYAGAPQRSHKSRALSGLVGAIAPVIGRLLASQDGCQAKPGAGDAPTPAAPGLGPRRPVRR